MKKRVISLANIALLIGFVIINHFAWLGIDFKYYFPSLFVFIAGRYLLPKAPNKWIDNLFSGYVIGWAIDVIAIRLCGSEESHIGEIMAIGMPLVGFAWRNYRKETERALKFTGIATLARYLIILLDKFFL